MVFAFLVKVKKSRANCSITIDFDNSKFRSHPFFNSIGRTSGAARLLGGKPMLRSKHNDIFHYLLHFNLTIIMDLEVASFLDLVQDQSPYDYKSDHNKGGHP